MPMVRSGTCRISLISPGTVRLFLMSSPPLGLILADILTLELSIAPDLNPRLVPPHARSALAARGLDLEKLIPMSKEEMMARLD